MLYSSRNIHIRYNNIEEQKNNKSISVENGLISFEYVKQKNVDLSFIHQTRFIMIMIIGAIF